jgi:hypothetical protein
MAAMLIVRFFDLFAHRYSLGWLFVAGQRL